MIENKKVAFFSLSFYPSMGGLVTYIDSFSTFLNKQGIKVDIYCGDAKDGSLPKKEIYKGAIIYRFSPFKFTNLLKIFSPIITAFNTFRFLKTIDFDEYDLIVCRHFYLAFALSFFSDAKDKTIFILPLITPKLQFLNTKQETLLKKIYGYIIIPQLFFLEKWAVRHLPHICVLSASKKVELISYYHLTTPISVIPPGINLNRFKPINSKDRAILRKQYIPNNNNQDVVICSVCRLVEEKNINTLLIAFEQVIRANNSSSNLKLVVAGDGPLRGNLEKLATQLSIDKHVIFIGNTDRPEDIYALSDIFVLPSIYEGFGHVLIEANACGIPAIGFKNNPPETITATDEVICDGINGMIAPYATSESLAKTIDKLLYQINEKGAASWQNQCINYVKDKFNWQQHFEKLLSQI